MSLVVHPRDALFAAGERAPLLPVADHYAGVEARMRKALALQGDLADRALFDVTLDLEDGAVVGAEAEQLALVAELIASPANRFNRVGVRLHPYLHPSFPQEVAGLLGHAEAATRLAFLMVPKVADAAELAAACAHIETAARAAGVTAPPVHALVETHGALHEVHALAALPAVESLSFGLMDFVSAHRGAIRSEGMRLQGQFSHPLIVRAKLAIAAACHAHGKTPSHSVITEFKDREAIAEAARRAAQELGYLRMWSIHPNQIAPIVEAFAPDPAEIDDAISILLAAQAQQWAPIAHKGLLHDRASFRYFWHVLERAERTGQALPAEVRTAFFDPAA